MVLFKVCPLPTPLYSRVQSLICTLDGRPRVRWGTAAARSAATVKGAMGRVDVGLRACKACSYCLNCPREVTVAMDVDVIPPMTRQWAQGVIAAIGRRTNRLSQRRKRKFLVVHLDGVPRGLLEEAIRAGRMPFFGSLVQSGKYKIDSAFWGSPASTPCFQAGVMYGLRHPNLPAYHWFDRELGRVVRMNVPQDTCAIEARLNRASSDSLLEGGGTAYLSLFRAKASNQLCMTSLGDLGQLSRSLLQDLSDISGSGSRGAWAFMAHLARDTWQTGADIREWVRQIQDGRHEREYLMNRFFMISLAWSLAHSRALVDMVRGVPAIYLVFGSYDEVAHRRGPLSDQATRELYRVDKQLAELYAVAKTLDEPYDIYFLTDHGHVDSAPIESRIGRKLEKQLIDGPPRELAAPVRRALLDGRVFTPESPIQVKDEPVVIEAGNFAHVYLSRGPEPLEAMALLKRYPAVLARAIAEPDIGIVAVRRGDSAVAIIQGEVYAPDRVQSSPLKSDFSKRAVADLLEELPHMKTAGDLVLFGDVCQPGGTVGFAWEFGSHGGLTKIETDSVIAWPSEVPVDLGALSHSTQLHQRLSELYRD